MKRMKDFYTDYFSILFILFLVLGSNSGCSLKHCSSLPFQGAPFVVRDGIGEREPLNVSPAIAVDLDGTVYVAGWNRQEKDHRQIEIFNGTEPERERNVELTDVSDKQYEREVINRLIAKYYGTFLNGNGSVSSDEDNRKRYMAEGSSEDVNRNRVFGFYHIYKEPLEIRMKEQFPELSHEERMAVSSEDACGKECVPKQTL